MAKVGRRLLPVLIVTILALVACNDQPRDSGDTSNAPPVTGKEVSAGGEYTWDGPPPARATIAFIGNFRGFLKPCGCAVQQSGGLLRLGTVMAELNNRLVLGQPATERSAPVPLSAEGAIPGGPGLEGLPAGNDAAVETAWPELATSQPVWLIECGNFAAPQNRYPAERIKTHLNALSKLKSRGFIAAVPGSAELQLTADLAAEGFADCPVRLTSCNLTSSLAEVQVEPYVEIAPGWYLVGVSTWAPIPSDPPAEAWWELTEPVDAVKAVLAELPPAARVILVATHQTGEVTRQLAALPVALVIGHGAESDQQWSAGLAPAFPAPPGKAIRLKLVSLDTKASDPATRLIPWEIQLTEEWEDDVEITAVVEAEKLAVREKLLAAIGERDTEAWREVDWGSAAKYLPDREATLDVYLNSEPVYVGSQECRKCHPDPYQAWKRSAHSHALLSLIDKDESETLDCLQCHVAGLLLPSGYDPFSSRDEVAAVTCESCHGPGSRHLALMNLPEQPEDPGIAAGNKADCLNCHDQYNSPDFEIGAYWEMIAHVDKWQDKVQQMRSDTAE